MVVSQKGLQFIRCGHKKMGMHFESICKLLKVGKSNETRITHRLSQPPSTT